MFQIKLLCRLFSIYPFQVLASYFRQVIPYSGMPLHRHLYIGCFDIVPQAVQFIALDSSSISSIYLLSADESQTLKVLTLCKVFFKKTVWTLRVFMLPVFLLTLGVGVYDHFTESLQLWPMKTQAGLSQSRNLTAQKANPLLSLFPCPLFITLKSTGAIQNDLNWRKRPKRTVISEWVIKN